jgi:hypothetical protein
MVAKNSTTFKEECISDKKCVKDSTSLLDPALHLNASTTS